MRITRRSMARAMHRPALAGPALAGLAVALVLNLGMVPVASVSAATPVCLATQLSARIVSWEGAAGSRIANVRLYNTSFVSCYVRNFP